MKTDKGYEMEIGRQYRAKECIPDRFYKARILCEQGEIVTVREMTERNTEFTRKIAGVTLIVPTAELDKYFERVK